MSINRMMLIGLALPTQGETVEALDVPDIAEHRFDGGKAMSVAGFSVLKSEALSPGQGNEIDVFAAQPLDTQAADDNLGIATQDDFEQHA